VSPFVVLGALHAQVSLIFFFQSIIVFVPYPQLKAYQKIQTRLVRELEKKFSGKHVVFVAKRRILSKPTRKMQVKREQKRPRRFEFMESNLIYPRS
jgi:hypothetical protein